MGRGLVPGERRRYVVMSTFRVAQASVYVAARQGSDLKGGTNARDVDSGLSW